MGNLAEMERGRREVPIEVGRGSPSPLYHRWQFWGMLSIVAEVVHVASNLTGRTQNFKRAKMRLLAFNT